MSGLPIGSRIANLDQTVDEKINVTSKHGKFKSIEEAQKKAEAVAKSDTEDAAILKSDDGSYEVVGVSEIGKLDADANDSGEYKIHDAKPNVLNFVVTKRDSTGKSEGKEINVSAGNKSFVIADLPKEMQEKLKVLDTNDDGRVTRVELEALRQKVITGQVSLKDAREALNTAKLLLSTKEMGGKVADVASSKELKKTGDDVKTHIESKNSLEDNKGHAMQALAHTLSLHITSANKFRNTGEAMVSELSLAPLAASRIWNGNGNPWARIENPEDVERVAKKIEGLPLDALRFGNCQEVASVAGQYLKEMGIKDVEFFGKPNHAFIVIGRDQNSNAYDPSSWGDRAVVCDPWYGETFPAKELPFRQNNDGEMPQITQNISLN
ncbi:MAG: hypothetical protein U0457_09005 [Candidatus Sericytochromatia bacterium]